VNCNCDVAKESAMWDVGLGTWKQKTWMGSCDRMDERGLRRLVPIQARWQHLWPKRQMGMAKGCIRRYTYSETWGPFRAIECFYLSLTDYLTKQNSNHQERPPCRFCKASCT
jgi:hypothetical protein